MEKSRAIDLLDNLIGMTEDNHDNDYDTAFRMAIDALKAQLSKEGTTSDLISRTATIDAVNNAFDRETLLTGFVRSIAVRAIRDMPPAQPEPQWISVSERLPEEDGKYMVTIHGYGWNGKTFTSVSVAECIGKRWAGNNGVIAWIPLPKPYEGEGEQE